MKRTQILVLRADELFAASLRDKGFEAICLEMIITCAITGDAGIREAIEDLNDFDGLIVTSPAALMSIKDHLAGQLASYRGTVFALGERSRRLAAKLGAENVARSAADSAVELATEIIDAGFIGRRLLYLRGERSLDGIADALGDVTQLTQITVYRTEPAPIADEARTEIENAIAAGAIGWVCFFSPSGVDAFATAFQDLDISMVKAAAIGSTTAAAARHHGFNISFVSGSIAADEFAAGLAEHINNFE